MVTVSRYAGNNGVGDKHGLMMNGCVVVPGYAGNCGVGDEYELMLVGDCALVRGTVVLAVSMS